MAQPTSAAGGDYANTSVPLNERRGPFTMGLLWVTMITAFPSVLIGFEWFKNGITLPQVLTCTGLSCLILLVYSIPATQLGARSGLSYTTLSRSIFGRWGSRLITINLIWMFICFYGLTALLMSEGLVGLFHWTIPIALLTGIMAILMSVNNFFGFKGVANFARFVAAPVLIGWVGFTFFKAVSHCPPDVLTQVPHQPFAVALTSISSFIIGYAVWGNELDYWRFSRPRVADSTIPLIAALVIGQVIFPVAGWMVARMTGVTEYGAATALMNEYSFGGIAILAALVLGASYFACNDSNLFGSLQACENLKQMSHQKWAIILALLGAVCGALLSLCGAAKSIEAIAALNCVMLPTPTVIMMGEWFLMAKVFKSGIPISDLRVPSFAELPAVKTSAVVALIAGTGVGLLTSGVIPGLEKLNVGIASLQGWLTALIIYIPLRMFEYRQEVASQRIQLELSLANVAEVHDLVS
jgi:purine-cytosine permease-like protein